jgi:uncharacterized protein
MHQQTLDELSRARYALLRSFRADGSPVDTPIWFGLDGDALLFRTKVGPKTRRLAARRDVELTPCERANRLLHRRYGWQWNIVPLIKVPGVTNVHRGLCAGEKFRRARARGVWPDSVIVRVDLP